MNTIALLNPEIPQNTGNIARLCVVTNTRLHLLGTLGFELSDKYLKRAGMDYWQYLDYKYFPDVQNYVQKLAMEHTYLLSTKSMRAFSTMQSAQDTVLLFGNESSGAPEKVQRLMELQQRTVRIPMEKNHRCLNLAVSVGIALYEILRQQNYHGLL